MNSEKHLYIGTGIDQAAAGNISIDLETTGYTEEQLFQAIDVAKKAIKRNQKKRKIRVADTSQEPHSSNYLERLKQRKTQ